MMQGYVQNGVMQEYNNNKPISPMTILLRYLETSSALRCHHQRFPAIGVGVLMLLTPEVAVAGGGEATSIPPVIKSCIVVSRLSMRVDISFTGDKHCARC